MSTTAQLPRGRHRLSRAEVAESQRDRLLRAMAEAVAELGYGATPVAEVLRRAGVSRESFYEHFADKEQCFLAAHDAGVETVLAAVREAAAAKAGSTDLERFSRGLRAYLEALAANPAVTRTFLVEVYAAGPAALERRVELQARFVDAVAELLKADGERERFACEALVAATSSLVTQRVCLGHYDELPALHGPISSLVGDALK